MDRRSFLAGGGALLAFGAAAHGASPDATEVAAPQWRTGDRWVYRRTDAFTRRPAGKVTRTVTSGAAPRLRVEVRDEGGRLIAENEYEAAGAQRSGVFNEDGSIRGSVTPALLLYSFPLRAGKSWKQSLGRKVASGLVHPMSASTRVAGWQQVRAGGREYRALVIRRRIELGQRDELIRDVSRADTEWYAPAVGAAVKLETFEEWVPRNKELVPSERLQGGRYVYELESFVKGSA